jgi:hypothetical protein
MRYIMLRSLITIVLVFAIAFGIKKAIAQDTPIFVCSKEQTSALRGQAINCSAVHEVLDALQVQNDFVIMNRLSLETETVCGKAFALARNLLEEDRPALRKKAPELLEKCSEAILAGKK